MKRIKVILNHTAGCGYGAKIEPKIRGFLKDEMLDFDLVLTKRPFHAIELAEQAVKSGFEIVVAAGGDGTTNEVVNGLMKASRILSKLADRARIPARSEISIIVGDFKETVQNAPKTDLNVFGISNDFDCDMMRDLSSLLGSSCIFIRDSGEESILV